MRYQNKLFLWIVAGVLLIMFGMALTSMKGDSPTFDEQGFLVRGLAYLRGEDSGGNRRIRVGHPLGLNALNAALLVNDPTVRLPSDDPSWQGTSFHRPAELFLWEIGNDVEHVMFLARLPTIWVGLLLAAVTARWAGRIASRWVSGPERPRAYQYSALVSLVLVAFDPNILAHTRLVTTDLGLAAAAALAGYTLWQFLLHPTGRKATLAGVSLGLLLNTKFTSLLFLPLFGLVIILGLYRLYKARDMSGDWKKALLFLLVYPGVAFLTLWAGHGFQTGVLQGKAPMLGMIGVPIPLSSYVDQLIDIGNRMEASTPSFLLGRYSDTGWWYYFPVAFLIKTPLPTLLLIGWAVIRITIKLIKRLPPTASHLFDLGVLFIPSLGYFAIALTTDINLGYRHLLPVLPFLYVATGAVLGSWLAEHDHLLSGRVFTVGLLAWLVSIALWIHPHFLAYFNIIAGGPNHGWRALVDSNLDWGQDLARLAAWQKEKEIKPIWLSYFGEGRPEYYGIDYIGLDGFPPRLMDPNTRPFYPDDPAPGWYAISATSLQGVHFANHDQFDYFRQRPPQEKIGYSIFLYNQPARGRAVDLLLGGIQMDELPASEFAKLQTNDVIPRWFDPYQAIVIPGGERPVWLALGSIPIHPLLVSLLNPGEGGEFPTNTISRAIPNRLEVPTNTTLFTFGPGRVRYLAAPELHRDGDLLTVLTLWQQAGSPQPVKMFVHILDNAGQIVTQWDGLGAAWAGWRSGDTLAQVIELPLEDVPPGAYRVVMGLYDPESLQRWQSTAGTDVLELGQITVPER